MARILVLQIIFGGKQKEEPDFNPADYLIYRYPYFNSNNFGAFFLLYALVIQVFTICSLRYFPNFSDR